MNRVLLAYMERTVVEGEADCFPIDDGMYIAMGIDEQGELISDMVHLVTRRQMVGNEVTYQDQVLSVVSDAITMDLEEYLEHFKYVFFKGPILI